MMFFISHFFPIMYAYALNFFGGNRLKSYKAFSVFSFVSVTIDAFTTMKKYIKSEKIQLFPIKVLGVPPLETLNQA